MARRFKRRLRQIIRLVAPVLQEKTEKKEFEFTLNKSRTDKLHWCIEVNTKGRTVKISDITFVIFINDTWQWVVRYDDHAGQGYLHRHERISLHDESETIVPLPIRKNGNKKKLTEWAIDDITNNYLHYRRRFLSRSKIALY